MSEQPHDEGHLEVNPTESGHLMISAFPPEYYEGSDPNNGLIGGLETAQAKWAQEHPEEQPSDEKAPSEPTYAGPASEAPPSNPDAAHLVISAFAPGEERSTTELAREPAEDLSNIHIEVEDIEHKEMTPEEVLDYVGKLSKSLHEYAVGVQAMLDKAEADGVKVDVNRHGMLDKFKPLGENEKLLLAVQSDLLTLQGELYQQGVRVPVAGSVEQPL